MGVFEPVDHVVLLVDDREPGVVGNSGPVDADEEFVGRDVHIGAAGTREKPLAGDKVALFDRVFKVKVSPDLRVLAAVLFQVLGEFPLVGEVRRVAGLLKGAAPIGDHLVYGNDDRLGIGELAIAAGGEVTELRAADAQMPRWSAC